MEEENYYVGFLFVKMIWDKFTGQIEMKHVEFIDRIVEYLGLDNDPVK